jgi:hypothetical protein
LPPLDGCGAILEDQVVAVAVHYQAGNAIGLCVKEAVGVRVWGEGVAVGEGAHDSTLEPGLVYGLAAAFRYAEGDLAFRVVEGVSEETSPTV